ncbi:MAG: mandelate racemase/muconate lactonizing enzyme family protein [Bryobacteraceae bacterium]
MKITRIDCHVLLDPGYDTGATSSAQDDIVVEIHTDEGISGIGETDVNPWMAKVCIEAPSTHTMGISLKDVLIGADPFAISELWHRMYTASAMNGRRGVVINAMGAIDIALHDILGKALGKPVWQLLGGTPRESITPYASLQPEVSSWSAYRESIIEWAKKAQAFGFRAAKTEITPCGPYAHKGLSASYDDMTQLVADLRSAVGPDFTLMADVQYAFPDAATALRVIREWAPYRLFFVETPLWPDDLEGHARLATEQPTPIASGEWLTTRWELFDLIDRGRVQVAQPDVGRIGGFTEAMPVCAYAAERKRTIVPHAWKTGISIAAAAHMAAVTPHCAFIEFLPDALCESALRKELATTSLEMRDGKLSLPTAPGLGVEVNRDAIDRFSREAAKLYRVG